MDKCNGTEVQKQMKDVSTDQVAKDIRELRDKGLIEESVVRAPFGKTDTYRFKISSAGIEFLQSMEEKGPWPPGSRPRRSSPDW